MFQEEIARAQDVSQLIDDQHALAETQEHTSEAAVESIVTEEIAEMEIAENVEEISTEENVDIQEDNKQEENIEEAL